jgi:hypothetical protein
MSNLLRVDHLDSHYLTHLDGENQVDAHGQQGRSGSGLAVTIPYRWPAILDANIPDL